MMVDVSKYVPVPFTGTGEPQTPLQEFRNWKGKWSLAERKLQDSPHVTDDKLPTYQLQEARLERRRSRSFEQRQPWLGIWNSCCQSSKCKTYQLFRDPPGAFKPSRASTTGPGIFTTRRSIATTARRTHPPHSSLEWRHRLLNLGRGVKWKQRRLKRTRMRTPKQWCS